MVNLARLSRELLVDDPEALHDLRDGWSDLEIPGERVANELLAFQRHWLVARPVEMQRLLLHQNVLRSSRFVERHLSGDQDVDDHAKRPDVGLHRVISFAFQYLRGSV